MINFRNILLTSAALGVLSGATAQAASLSIALDTPSVFLMPGQTAIFHGTITNLEAFTVDLNSGVPNVPPLFINDGGVLFVLNAPFTLTAGQVSDPFDIFSVTIPVSYSGPWGTFSPAGTFAVLGGIELPAGTTPDAELGQVSFDLTVVPEPGTFALLGLALPVAFVLKRRLM
jgi:hypothetical protein